MARHIAIVLHGPPCAGKTTISKQIRQRHSQATHISLDEGWSAGEVRYRGGTGRYADPATAQATVLIVEIGCGEPVDLAFPGATRAANEWVDVIRGSGRTLFPFLVWAEWQDEIARIEKRWQQQPWALGGIWHDVGLYSLYERGHPIATFPAIPIFQSTGSSQVRAPISQWPMKS
jgi:hypothetical protein